MTTNDSALRLWNAFCAEHSPGKDDYAVWYFGDNETDANELVQLVLDGTKRGTASALWAHEADGEAVPRPGELAVVTNWLGEAQCIIRTTAVEIVPYKDVSEDFAAIEGEGDKSLRYWRELHWPYFGREMQRIGRSLTDSIPIVCHQFERLFP